MTFYWVKFKGDTKYRKARPVFKTLESLQAFYGRKISNNTISVGFSNGKPVVGTIETIDEKLAGSARF